MQHNIIAEYTASDINDLIAEQTGKQGDLLDMEIAYLHEERDADDKVMGYWFINNTHHDYSLNLGIFNSQEEAEAALVVFCGPAEE